MHLYWTHTDSWDEKATKCSLTLIYSFYLNKQLPLSSICFWHLEYWSVRSFVPLVLGFMSADVCRSASHSQRWRPSLSSTQWGPSRSRKPCAALWTLYTLLHKSRGESVQYMVGNICIYHLPLVIHFRVSLSFSSDVLMFCVCVCGGDVGSTALRPKRTVRTG